MPVWVKMALEWVVNILSTIPFNTFLPASVATIIQKIVAAVQELWGELVNPTPPPAPSLIQP